MTGVASHECQRQSRSQELGSWAAKGTPRLTQGLEQAMGPDGGCAVRSTVPVRTRGLPGCASGGSYHPPHHTGRACGGRGRTAGADWYGHTAFQPVGVAGQCRSSGSHCGGQLVRRAVIGAGDVSASHANHHQPRGLRQRTCFIPKKLLQHHTHSHHQWVKRLEADSVQAELVAAGWAWLGPTLLVRAHDGSEHADDEGLTPRQRRKLILEQARRRAT